MNIKTVLTKLAEKITGTFNQIQDTVSSYLHSEKITISDLATFIKEDANTLKKSKHFLGLDFNQYELIQGDLHFILETKGKEVEKILALTLYSKGNAFIKYRSYDPKTNSTKTISIPPISH